MSGRHWVRAAYIITGIAALVGLALVNINDPYHGL